MTDLIERLKSATEGSRELDEKVLRAFGWDTAGGGWRSPHKQYFPVPPSPTKSIDDALMLLPGGWGWQIDHDGNVALLCLSIYSDSMDVELTAATPALALCAAALKVWAWRFRNDKD